MQTNRFLHQILPSVAFAMLGIPALAAPLVQPHNGSVNPAQAQAPSLVSPEQSVPLVFGLRLRNEDALQRLLTELSNPTSRLYHHWLTPAQFATRFSPTQSDVDTVTAYLRDHGIRVLNISPNRLLIQALATATSVDNVFNVQLHKVSGGFTNSVEPKLPSDIAKVVQSVSGLNSLAMMKSQAMQHAAGAQQPVAYSPSGIATAYNFPNVNNRHNTGGAYSGAGTTIAIVTAFGYNPQDLVDFYTQFGIRHTGRITNIPIGGETSVKGVETTLDLEQATSQAPDADVLMYIAATPAFRNLDLAFNQVVCDNDANVVSFSWGIEEAKLGWSQMFTLHEIFEQAAAQGIVIFAASGDDGAYGTGDDLEQPVLATSYPSSDPLITAVGGTTLQTNVDSTWKTESAWSGSGGGISIFWDRSAWQTGTGVPAYGWYAPANQKRTSCDVSFNADPSTGYPVRFGGKWLLEGGTSCGTPNWAALWALAEQGIGSRIGGSNITIYAMANSANYSSLFHDVTQGNNGGDNAGDPLSPGYNAGVGWDYPTGWGSPNGQHLVAWLLNHRPLPETADDLNQ